MEGHEADHKPMILKYIRYVCIRAYVYIYIYIHTCLKMLPPSCTIAWSSLGVLVADPVEELPAFCSNGFAMLSFASFMIVVDAVLGRFLDCLSNFMDLLLVKQARLSTGPAETPNAFKEIWPRGQQCLAAQLPALRQDIAIALAGFHNHRPETATF